MVYKCKPIQGTKLSDSLSPIQLLGHEVYSSERSFAVKICDIKDPVKRRSAYTEKAILSTIQSTNICQFFAFYEDEYMSKTYLVLEHVGNQNLFDFVKERYS